MSKLITQIKRVALALCLATPIVSWATPTADVVWRNNLGQSYSIYAVTQRDAALSEGKLTVSSTWGEKAPYFDMEGLGAGTVSVLVKYSGLDIAQVYESDADSVGVAFASVIDSDNNVVGACVQKADSANTVRAYYCGASSSEATPKDIGSMTAVGGEGYLLFSYKHDTGSRTYMGTSIDSLAGGQDTAGHWSNRTVKKLVLGGDESGKAFNGAGFTIEEVAIFVGSYLSNEDVADYVFPTLNVDDTATMTMTELNAKVAAFGENTFNYFSASPVVTYDVAPSDATTTYLRSALWNGTVFIKDQNIVNLNPTIYGNPNSTLKLSGVSGHWGAAVYEKTATPAIELEDSETEGKEYGYYASNGYSFYSQGAYYYVHTPELKGSGTYKANTTGSGALFVADKFDNFTGKLDLEGKTVWLGTGAPTKSVDTWNNQVNFPGTVRLGGSTIPSNYSTWTVPNGYKGTLRLTTAVSEQYQVSFLTSSAWKGTCQLAWSAGNSAFDIVNYGNANSVIEVATNFGAFPTQNGGTDGAEVAAEVKIAENVTWTVSNGWTAESYRTTFAKLSGAGNLTVNGGSGGVGEPLPYTITRLEGFTGTIAGTRGKFTIGTIVAATEPTPGTKLVNITTSNEPVLDSTKVVYNNAEQDVKLEFRAGDGIYVADPVVANITSADGETVTPYTDAATAFAAVQEGETLTLLADLELTETITVTNSFTLGGAVTVSSGSNSIGLQMSGATLTVTDDITITAFLMGGDADAQFVFPTTKYNQNAYKVKAGPDFFMDASVNYDVVADADAVAGTTTYKWVLRSTFIFDVTKNHSSVTYEGGAAVTRRTDVAANEVIEFFVTPEANYTVTSVVAETEDGTTTLTPVEGKYSVTVTKNVAVTVNTAASIPEATVNGKSFVLTQVGDSNVRTGSVTLEEPFASVSDALAMITIKTAAGKVVTGGYNISAELSDGRITANYTVTLKDVDFSGAETLWTDAEEGKVVLNAAVVEGLYYGVTADGSISSTLTTKPTLTEATAENKATILKADKQTGDAGFYKVWISDEE